MAPDECWALQTGRLHLVEDPHTGLVCRHVQEPPPTCYLCAPMIAHGETLGMFHMRMNRHNRASSEAALPESLDLTWLARTMAERLALALADMRLRETLRTQSICDPLTGWYNRRYMEETLERDIRRAARNEGPLAIIMFDVDNFKEFNDSFGHEAGDVALQDLCQMLKTHIRATGRENADRRRTSGKATLRPFAEADDVVVRRSHLPRKWQNLQRLNAGF
jgi:GAF domain-containing protein